MKTHIDILQENSNGIIWDKEEEIIIVKCMQEAVKQVQPKKITVSLLRNLEKQVLAGEISYSRMVEILNEQFASQDKWISKKESDLLIDFIEIHSEGHAESYIEALKRLVKICAPPPKNK